MENKEDLIISLQERLNKVFVEDYVALKSALDDINMYLKAMGIDYVYPYDIFCKDFITTSKSFISKMTVLELDTMDKFVLIQEIVAIMIYYKINENLDNEDDRSFKLLQHILIKKNA